MHLAYQPTIIRKSNTLTDEKLFCENVFENHDFDYFINLRQGKKLKSLLLTHNVGLRKYYYFYLYLLCFFTELNNNSKRSKT